MNASFLKAYDWFLEWDKDFENLPIEERSFAEDQAFADQIGWVGDIRHHGTSEEGAYADSLQWFLCELFIAFLDYGDGTELSPRFTDHFDKFIDDAKKRLNLKDMPWEHSEILT